jgi:peptide/nickel transport system ATP-binding protein
MSPGGPLLEVRELRVTFSGDAGRIVRAVDGVSFSLEAGRTLGIVGESGSGKSVTALSIMRLLPKETSRVEGSIRLEGRSLLDLPERGMREIRGNRIAMIFQEPMTSLNPSYTVGDQIGEALVRHRGLGRPEARAEAIRLLDVVRIPSAAQRIDDYPHKLSGGMRQRVMIAMALALGPALLIADEPTTALDVTIQAQILDLLRDLKTRMGTSIVLITHDLGVVAEMCDDVAVMYSGEIVEHADVMALFERPEHPYTIGLLGSVPRLDEKRDRLAMIAGVVPSLAGAIQGCRFAARCPFADRQCESEAPHFRDLGHGHLSRCWKAPLDGLIA